MFARLFLSGRYVKIKKPASDHMETENVRTERNEDEKNEVS